MNNIDKTIPYRPSLAELESLRLLRKRTRSSSSIQPGEEEEEKMAGEINVWKSDVGPMTKKVDEDRP